MMQYLGSWQFWVSVIVVSFIAHYAISKLMGSTSLMGGQSSS